jgi:hypothetical protein
MDYLIGKAARLIKALALGLAATLAVFAVEGLHTKTDTEFAGILMLRTSRWCPGRAWSVVIEPA